MDTMKCQLIKTFLQSYSEYLLSKSEVSLNSLHRNLKILSVTADLSIFDPDTCEATEFYVSLHELMMSVVPRSSAGVVWIAIDVLHHACKNPSARSALIDTYKFTPMLSRILGDNLNMDRRLKVLKLLEVLTYSAKLTWQEAHLTPLVITLTNWIMSPDEEQTIIDISLSVLVNLCYKNLPPLYTLMRNIDMKTFVRAIFKLQKTSSCSVQVCKMLLILEEVNGPLEETPIKGFLSLMFSFMTRAFSRKDIYIMRHIVDFFCDIQTNPRLLDILHEYPSMQKDAESLISQVSREEEPNHECIGQIFELFNMLMTLKAPGLSPIYLQLVTLAMRWIQTELACTPALLLIRAISDESRASPTLTDAILEQLNQGLEVLLLVLDTDADASSLASRSRQPALLQLLCSMVSVPAFRRKLLERLPPSALQVVVAPLATATATRPGSGRLERERTLFLVNALNLVSCLAEYDTLWAELFESTIAGPQVLAVLAEALVGGGRNVKELVLEMVAKENFSRSRQRMSALAAAMCETESAANLPMPRHRLEYSTGLWDDMTPMVSVKEEGVLSKFIGKLEEADERGEIKDLATSAVMQLYEYKLAARGSCERALHNSLEAASNQTTHLQHRLARMSAEASRFHRLLFHNQQSIEGLREGKDALEARLKESEKKVALLTDKLTSKRIQLKTSEDLLAEKCAQIVDANKKIENLETGFAIKEKSNLALLDDLKNDMKRLNERIEKRNTIILQKDEDLSKMAHTIKICQEEKANLEQIYQAQLLDIKKKESTIDKLSADVRELKKFKETVFKMASTQETK